jgi:septum formation protein
VKHLLLGSKSKSRQFLLKESGIKFRKVDQTLDEAKCDWTLPLRQLVETIAQQKMEHVVLPISKKKSDFCFVLTADTLGKNHKGEIQGKPKDKVDAIKKIKSYRNGAITGTALCLDKRVWESGVWRTEKRIIRYEQAEYIFDIPDHLIEWYLEKGFKKQNYLDVSGAVQIEGLGAQFLKTIQGSYSAVLGLPLFELRKALEDLGYGY